MNEEIKLAEECGLATLGKNEDGEQEYMGTNKQWGDFNKALSK